MHFTEYLKIEYWQLATDVALALSLVFLAYRLSRGAKVSADAHKLISIESSLRSLLSDANEASKDLNQQLVKRQQTLEKLLLDLQSAENRIGRSLAGAEGQSQSLTMQIEQAKSVSRELSISSSAANASRAAQTYSQPYNQSNFQDVPFIPAVRQEAHEFTQAAPEPPSFELAVRAPDAARRTAARPDSNSAAARTNIYGEVVETAHSAAIPAEPRAARQATVKPSPLAATIEKQVEHKTTQETLEQLYGAAERMLRAGKDVERVALQTDLPIDEVRILSQLIQQEKAAQTAVIVEPSSPAQANDERLGVLGGIKRQVQTL